MIRFRFQRVESRLVVYLKLLKTRAIFLCMSAHFLASGGMIRLGHSQPSDVATDAAHTVSLFIRPLHNVYNGDKLLVSQVLRPVVHYLKST